MISESLCAASCLHFGTLNKEITKGLKVVSLLSSSDQRGSLLHHIQQDKKDSSMASSSSTYNSPCAACKFLRRKCMPGCIFAPYFPPEEPQKFANVHKIFGASNVTKLLNDLLPHQREDAVNSLAYEAEARVRDPVYGCVGAISFLQRQIERLQKELDAANADLFRISGDEITYANPTQQSTSLMNTRRQHHQHFVGGGNDQIGNNVGMGFYQTPGFGYAYSLPWGDGYNNPNGGGMSGNL